MIEYKISENQLNLLLEAINCHQDEYREAKFDKKNKTIKIKGHFGCDDFTIQLG